MHFSFDFERDYKISKIVANLILGQEKMDTRQKFSKRIAINPILKQQRTNEGDKIITINDKNIKEWTIYGQSV